MIKPYVELVAYSLEIAGIAAIVTGILYTTLSSILLYINKSIPSNIYSYYRIQLSRSILLGLEFLVGADIIKTVAVTTTLRSVATLSIIVLVRTFLSFTLELEINGRWPWQSKK